MSVSRCTSAPEITSSPPSCFLRRRLTSSGAEDVDLAVQDAAAVRHLLLLVREQATAQSKGANLPALTLVGGETGLTRRYIDVVLAPRAGATVDLALGAGVRRR